MPQNKKSKKIQKKTNADSIKNRVRAILSENSVLTENSNEARLLFEQGRFGSLQRQQVQLSLLEAAYLIEKEKINVFDKKKKIEFEDFLKKAKKLQPNFWIKYCVFRDIRNRGYIIKTALKFGADFRVYDRGVKPGQDHARWIVYPVNENEVQTWHEFAAKNRVAHSTKKRLMIAVVDDESEISYWEVKWFRP
ncbi:MAG: tRNA-intron lyase [Candidatus Woesearchaeota archaeon]